MRSILLFIVYSLLSTSSHALELQDVSVEYYRFLPGSRHHLIIPPEQLMNRVGLNLDVDLLGHWLYWNNTVHSETSESQFRGVGWQTKLGVRPLPFLDLGFHHHSQHALDTTLPNMRFPVEDGFYVRFYLMKKSSWCWD